jgi:methionyl-tRNA formyltransferase
METINKKNLKFIFMGTPQFGAIVLERLITAGYRPSLVATEPDKPAGRKLTITPPPVKTSAEKYNIPVFQPVKTAELSAQISKLAPDLIIVVAYGRIIPKSILEMPKYGVINVHPSLLPKYRGPSPIQAAILNGDEKTGVTIMLLDEQMDHGPFLSQEEIDISDFRFFVLYDKLAELGAKLLLETIPNWVSKKIKEQVQDEKMATYTKIMKKEDGKIDWAKSAQEIERQIRAFDPWPGSFTFADDKMLKIWKAKVQEQTEICPIGELGKTFMATNEQIAIQTGKDFLIIEELQIEGGKRMPVETFLKGHSDFIGTILK